MESAKLLTRGLGLAFFLALSGNVFAETPVSTNDESVRKVGVAWNIASDRKIENDGGLYQPEGLDKYMKRYFDKIMERMDALSEQNDRLEKKVEELISRLPQPSESVPPQKT